MNFTILVFRIVQSKIENFIKTFLVFS